MAQPFSSPCLAQLDCQRLLREADCKHSSWMRKQSFWNKFQVFKWPQVFVVLCGEWVYYYRNETAKTPSGYFSLYGYNKVERAYQVPPKDAPWAFRIVHTHPEYKTYLFSASSEQEMKEWMKKIKKEMKSANSINIRSKADGQETDDDNVSETYQQIESKIYEDASEFLIPKDYKNRRAQDFDDDDDLYRRRAPEAPPVPPRDDNTMSGKGGKTAGPKQVKELSKELSSKLDLTRQAKDASKGITRGRADGASVKREAIQEQTYQDTGVAEDEDMDPAKYWGSIFYHGSESVKANEIIRTLCDEGVYLVRDRQDSASQKVLVVYIDELPRKFKILHQNGEYFLESKKSVTGRSIAELMNYYYDNPLPNYKACLTTPYLLHPLFKPSMLQQ